MSVQARGILKGLGIHPALDVTRMDPLNELGLRTREDVTERLAADAMAEVEHLGYPGRLHALWQAALAQGLDEQLPSLHDHSGAISRSTEELMADAMNARELRAEWIDQQRADPRLLNLSIGNQRLVDMPREDALEALHMMMADSQPGPGRDALSDALSLFESAPTSGFTSISWELPPEQLSYEVNSSSTIADGNDAFGRLRAPGMAADHGLEGLAIRPSVFPDPLLSGVVNYAGGGGEYSVADDVYYQAAQQGGSDFHQGDSSNVEHL